MVNWMKVEDNVKSMKRSKGSRGNKEIRKKIDLMQNDAETRVEKKARQQTRRFLSLCSSKHTIVLRRKAKLIRLRDVALHKERDVR